MTCPKGHGEFNRNQCPICCLHKGGRIYLDNGPRCWECGRVLWWISKVEMENLEKELRECGLR